MTAAPVGAGRPLGRIAAFGVLGVLGAAAFASSFGYGILVEGNRVGPGLMPMVTGLLLLMLSGWQLGALWRAGGSRSPGPAPADSDRASAEEVTDVLGRPERQRIRQLSMVVLALPVTILLIPLLGLLVAFGLLVLFVCAVIERRRAVPSVVITAVSVAAGYLVFDQFLGVPLPGGLLGDLVGG